VVGQRSKNISLYETESTQDRKINLYSAKTGYCKMMMTQNKTSKKQKRFGAFIAIALLTILTYFHLAILYIAPTIATSHHVKPESMVLELIEANARIQLLESKVARQRHQSRVYQKYNVSDPPSQFITSKENVLDMLPSISQGGRLVYVITPTYDRLLQKLDLIRMSQPLMLSSLVYWIVVEDLSNKGSTMSHRVRKILFESNIPFAHSSSVKTEDSSHFRGVEGRNEGIRIVKKLGLPGVVYFGDDDNAYDYRLFEEIRNIKRVGVWATGLSGNGNFEACSLDSNGIVTDFYTNFRGRKFGVDMGGFAFSTDVFIDNPEWNINIAHTARYKMEDSIVSSLISEVSQAEPINNCSVVRFWHMAKPSIPKSYSRKVQMHGRNEHKFLLATD